MAICENDYYTYMNKTYKNGKLRTTKLFVCNL